MLWVWWGLGGWIVSFGFGLLEGIGEGVGRRMSVWKDEEVRCGLGSFEF